MIELDDHLFVRGLSAPHRDALRDLATFGRHAPGSFLLREGVRETRVHLLVAGQVALELHAPGRPPVAVETLGAGEVLGIAWMFDDMLSHLDARATSEVAAFTLDGARLRAAMDADVSLGYAISQRLLERAYHRLARARLARLDLYGGRT